MVVKIDLLFCCYLANLYDVVVNTPLLYILVFVSFVVVAVVLLLNQLPYKFFVVVPLTAITLNFSLFFFCCNFFPVTDFKLAVLLFFFSFIVFIRLIMTRRSYLYFSYFNLFALVFTIIFLFLYNICTYEPLWYFDWLIRFPPNSIQWIIGEFFYNLFTRFNNKVCIVYLYTYILFWFLYNYTNLSNGLFFMWFFLCGLFICIVIYLYKYIYISINSHTCWWPWFNPFDDVFALQFFICFTIFYMLYNNNIYYILLYIFFNFFLIGLYLAFLQLELFTAFLWLVECSVLFVFLLLLFFLNIKGSYNFARLYLNSFFFKFITICLLVLFSVYYGEVDNVSVLQITYGLVDNYYEFVYNVIVNDLFGFNLSYYFVNAFEFLIVGFLLLVGSVICVNLYLVAKTTPHQNYSKLLHLFDFFNNFLNFFFLRKQSLIKQGNVKASLKVFKKI